MNYQEIIDTIKVGDYVEVKGDPDFEDGVYEVMSVDKFDDGASVRLYNKRNILWVYDRCIVRKISDGETEQASQNENDNATYSVCVPTQRKQARNKYDREIVKGVFVDVYDVLDAFQVTDPCLQHLIKKALAVGIRGHKDAYEDYTDILDSAKRALEKYEEKSL